MNAITMKRFINVIDSIGTFKDMFSRPKGVERVFNVRYSDFSNKNKLDIFYPEGETKRLPLIIYVHGGGWMASDKSRYVNYCMKLAKQGFLVFSINYRLAPKFRHPSCIMDTIDAINWVKKNAKAYNGDLNNIALGGDSAGAHIINTIIDICLNEEFRAYYKVEAPLKIEQIKAAFFYYGAFRFLDSTGSDFGNEMNYDGVTLTGTKKKNDKGQDEGFMGMSELYLGVKKLTDYPGYQQIMPIDFITEKFPPTLVLSGQIDFIHKSTLEMIEKLTEKGIEFKKIIYDKSIKEAQHGFMNNHHTNPAKECLQEVAAFIKNKVG